MEDKYVKMLNEYTEYINASLDALISDLNEDEDYMVLGDAMKYSLKNGGKRLRPMLTLEFCRLCGGEYSDAVYFACAVEMIHTYSLIHDDLPCMDDSDLRRGKPACHKTFGENYALLAGDGLLTYAFEVITKSDLPDTVKIKAVEILAHSAGPRGMVAGQCIDLLNENRHAGIQILEKTDLYKTVFLLKAACIMGCIAANATEEYYEAASIYAENMGLAFQIKDDILDATGDSDKLGKPTGNDIEDNKTTYVSEIGIERSQELVESLTEEAAGVLSVFGPEAEFLKQLTASLAEREN